MTVGLLKDGMCPIICYIWVPYSFVHHSKVKKSDVKSAIKKSFAIKLINRQMLGEVIIQYTPTEMKEKLI